MTYRDPDLVRAIVLYPEVGAADAHAERLRRRLRQHPRRQCRQLHPRSRKRQRKPLRLPH